eukprot:TCALIF_01087-PA protein Name:"Similar to PDIA3 Protein disulfide-isomerase A3 (Gallus gallus)" AED:0.03 eAED:0.03 QI:0/0/0/0.66/1/1/3/0/490
MRTVMPSAWTIVWTCLVWSAVLSGGVAQSVIELGDASFDTEMETFDTALVMFYAPWCGHCKRLKPEFDKAAEYLGQNDPPVHLVKVDCTEDGKEVCGRFEVKGYPTLKIFRGGEMSQDYNGPRELKGIVKYMQAQVGPASKHLKSQAEVDQFVARPEVVVVASLAEDSDDMATFLKTAESLREEVLFGHCTDDKLCGFKGIQLRRPAHLQTKLEASQLTFDGAVKKDQIKKWIKDNYHGLVGHRTLDNGKDFPKPLVVVYYDVDYVKNVKGTNYWRNRVMKVAKAHTGLNFAVSNKDDFMQEMNEFGLTGVGQTAPDATITTADGKKYVMSDTFSVDTFASFIQAYEAGSLEAYIKSEDLPDNEGKPVKVAVARNFDELVTKSEKDVLVEFYAPWCGHCKKLTPIYDELGTKMEGENVEIVKMDATANDVPSGFDVRGFPTLFWLPKSTKKAVAYQGGRELDDFVKFIAENASSELNQYDRKGKPKKAEL